MLPSAPQALVRLYSLTNFSLNLPESPSRPGRMTRMYRGWESMQNFFSVTADQTKNFLSDTSEWLSRGTQKFFSHYRDLSVETARQANNCLSSYIFWSTVHASAVNMFVWNMTRPDLIAYHLAPYLIMPICYMTVASKLAKEAVICVAIKRGANQEQAERAAYQLLLQVTAQTIVAYKKYREPAQQAVEGEAPAAEQAASKLDWMKELGKDLVDGAVIRFNDPELQPMKQGMLAGACALPILNLALGDTPSLIVATIAAAGVALRSTNLNAPN